MDSYTIEFKEAAERDLRKINPKLIPNIIKKIELLPANPLPRQSLKLYGAEATYRLKVGHYRIIYEIVQKTKSIVVHYIRHRKDVYRRL